MKTTRREFLAAAAAVPLSPIILGTQDKAGTKRPVLGSGAHTYEAIHDWGTLPAHIKWGNTHAVVEDSQGHMFVHHTVHAVSDTHDILFGLHMNIASFFSDRVRQKRIDEINDGHLFALFRRFRVRDSPFFFVNGELAGRVRL